MLHQNKVAFQMYVRTLHIVLRDIYAKIPIAYQVTRLTFMCYLILLNAVLYEICSLSLSNNIPDDCKNSTDCPTRYMCKDGHCIPGNIFKTFVRFHIVTFKYSAIDYVR